MAHDFNNLLTVILGYSDLLLSSIHEGDLTRPAVEEIARAAERSAELTKQLLAFSRQQPVAPGPLDLNAVLAGLARMLPRLLGPDVQLAIVPRPGLHRVWADGGQIEQVILNLAANARDAMPLGGRLTLETQDVDLDFSYTRLHPGLQPGPYVLLSVSDTGCGISEEVRSHLFEPFFTTKEKGKGTGLGLATVYGIVKQNGGHVAVYSEPGQGTSVKVYLPRQPANAAAAASEAERPAPPVSGGAEMVLLVEDDESVRCLVSSVLRQQGYRVIESGDGPSALLAAETQGEAVDLLVIDVVLPGLSGREVAERLTAVRPALKVLFLSGYTDHAVVRHGVLDAEMAFLQKPFTPDVLARKVRGVLDGMVTA